MEAWKRRILKIKEIKIAMVCYKIASNGKEELLKFLEQLLEVYKAHTYDFGFVINSSLLELHSKMLSHFSEIENPLKNNSIDTIDIRTKDEKTTLDVNSIDEILFEDNVICVLHKDLTQQTIIL